MDALAGRLEVLKLEQEQIRATFCGQVETYDFTPQGAEESKRQQGEKVPGRPLLRGDDRDPRPEVERIERACPLGLFAKLFREVRQYKLAAGASMLLAGTLPSEAPRNLRQIFSQAVILKPRAPSLSVKRNRRG